MRRNLAASCVALLLALGCTPERGLRIAVAPDPLTPRLASVLAEILRDAAGLELEVVTGEGSVSNLESLQRGEADLTIVENNAPYRRDVRTVTPLYEGVLHVLHEKEASPADAAELFRGKTVFAGEPGGMGRWFLQLVTTELGIPEDAYTLVESGDDQPQVVFLFRPISPAVTRSIEDRYAFFSIGEPDELGRGAIVEGLALEYPQMDPFVIPARTYGRANPRAVVTMSVATLLVAREELPAHLVYDLIEAIVDHKQELATVHPSLFHGINHQFDADGLGFPLHAGTRDYLRRDEPGLLERYAELAGVSFTVTLALLSAVIAVGRWRERVKKNRIDAYYAKVLRVRAASLEYTSAGAFQEAVAQIRALEQEAFGELIDERVAADESFRIFIALANDTLEDLKRRADPLAATPPLASTSSGR